MIRFFQTPQKSVIATEVDHVLSEQEIKELNRWSASRNGDPVVDKCC